MSRRQGGFYHEEIANIYTIDVNVFWSDGEYCLTCAKQCRGEEIFLTEGIYCSAGVQDLLQVQHCLTEPVQVQ